METYYPGMSLAYEKVQKDEDDQPINVLARNVHRIKKDELKLSNAKVAAILKGKGRQKDIAKTVSNIEKARHNVGIGNIASVAEALGVELWQLFVDKLPNEPRIRGQLSRLVRAFLLMEDEENRKFLLGPIEALLIREGKLDQFHKDMVKRGRTDRDATKSPRLRTV